MWNSKTNYNGKKDFSLQLKLHFQGNPDNGKVQNKYRQRLVRGIFDSTHQLSSVNSQNHQLFNLFPKPINFLLSHFKLATSAFFFFLLKSHITEFKVQNATLKS